MEIKIIGATNLGSSLPKKDSLEAGSKFAAICYTERNFNQISDEPVEATLKRQNMTLSSGHHSVYEHTYYNLYISGLPKILAMVLNNENVYVTSEKSARYTKMNPAPKEKELYDKWITIFDDKIKQTYPKIDEIKRVKLSQENARYLTSVFTPTNMAYTVSFRQLNYLMHFFKDFMPKTNFEERLKGSMTEFNHELSDLFVEELEPDIKMRRLSFFTDRKSIKEDFGETYSANYFASFAELAQAHRHRTISYQIQKVGDDFEFFTPPILDINLAEEWAKDIKLVSSCFPQGMMVSVNERGRYEDFISKCYERLCGQAQLEIMSQTRQTLQRYASHVKSENLEVYNSLLPLLKGPKCSFPGVRCSSACFFGKNSLDRKI